MNNITKQFLNRYFALTIIWFGWQSLVFADEPAPAEPPVTKSDRQHWAFQPLTHPMPPAVRNRDRCRTAIDRFVIGKLGDAKLPLADEAERSTLLRRVCFDLIGLPPNDDLQDDALNNTEPDWYERLVDRLLASPHYGERWAQHWLDVARFADTDGFEHDHVRPQAWRFRDWVIGAFNRDLPLDEFLRQQLAGDELHPCDESALIATGFLFCGPDMPDINLQDERRLTFLNDMTGTVGAVFLGLQMGCAACHDHKYDPISQLDFYRLRAFFDVEPLFDPHPQFGMVMREKTATPPTSRLFERGDFRRPGPIVLATFPRIADPHNTPLGHTNDAERKTSGRRSALAHWLTTSDNALAARVLANRVWQGHFGRGLVETANDFGVMGAPPTHPELLDWLASEVMGRGGDGETGRPVAWSLKRLHRLIVTSSVYRQGSHQRLESSDRFENNTTKLLARFPRQRLDGEQIRDAMLSASGQLNRQMHGPGIRPPLPNEIVRTLLKNQWPVTPEADQHTRRSTYLFVRRNLRYPLFEAFDKPDGNASCPRRNVSTIAPQSLLLLNGNDAVQAARMLAEQLQLAASYNSDSAIESIYRAVLNRRPTPDELAAAARFLTDSNTLADLCLAMFNLNEFVYVD